MPTLAVSGLVLGDSSPMHRVRILADFLLTNLIEHRLTPGSEENTGYGVTN